MDGKEYVRALAARLGVEPLDDATIDTLLELAGVAAHSSERIAAPLACYLVGKAGATVGPFSFLRPGTVLGPRGKIGAFVETKNAVIGEGISSEKTYPVATPSERSAARCDRPARRRRRRGATVPGRSGSRPNARSG